MDWIWVYLNWNSFLGVVLGGVGILIINLIFPSGKPRTYRDVSHRGLERVNVYKRGLINEVRKRKKAGQYFPSFPNGWFAVCESASLQKKGVQEAYYFGKELVIWRGEDGVAYVADAYCPHLGAHLGVEGQVKGNCIQCPFHHWQFDGSKGGKLACVPYSEKSTLGNVNLKMWKTLERNGFVFVWYHADGKEPTWEPPAIQETNIGHCQTRMDTTIGCHIQDIFENGADIAHFVPIHGSFFGNGEYLADTPVPSNVAAHGDWESSWKVEEERPYETTVTIISKLQVFGVTVSKIDILGKEYGPGIFVNFYDTPAGRVVAYLVATPVDRFLVRVVQHFYSTTVFARMFSIVVQRGHAMQFARDVCIWNRKIDRGSPPLVKEDKQIKTFRRYYGQFYSNWDTNDVTKDI